MEWEFFFLNYIQTNLRNPFFDTVMPIISLLGKYGAAIIVIFIIAIISKKHKRLSMKLLFSVVLTSISCLILKSTINRMRPYVLDTTVQLIVKPEVTTSFPSGHTFFAFSSATVCFMYNKKLGIVMYIYAIIMAFSRLYLYVHFPTDVLFGIIFGIITGIIAYKLEDFVFTKKENLHKKSY